jgi:hypothetical protein
MSLARVVLMFASVLPGFAVPITGGSMTLSGISEDQTVQFSLRGENFDVRGGHYFAFHGPFVCNAEPCQPGETVELGVGLHFGGFGYPGGSGTVNGVYYDRLFFNNYPDGWGPDVSPITLVAGVTSYTVPFTMVGNMRILNCRSPEDCLPEECIFNCDDPFITGRGMVTANFFSNPEGLTISHFIYEFAAPIPEPSTVLLICGCVPLWWVWRRAVR